MDNRLKTHCPQGHEYTPENTRIHRGRRECRICIRERDRQRRDKEFWAEYRSKRKAADPSWGTKPPIPPEQRKPTGRKARPLLERFMEKFAVLDSGCWEWTGSRFGNGYGQFPYRTEEGKYFNALAHRWFYENQNGPVPLGLQLDHLCFNRACVRLSHLEVVTGSENVRRAKQR